MSIEAAKMNGSSILVFVNAFIGISLKTETATLATAVAAKTTASHQWLRLFMPYAIYYANLLNKCQSLSHGNACKMNSIRANS